MAAVVLVWAAMIVWTKSWEDVEAQDFVAAEAMGLAIAGILWCRLVPGHTLRVAPRNIPGLAAVALTTSFAALYLWFEGLHRTSIASASFIAHTQVLFIATLGAWRLGERLKLHEMLGAGLMMVSALLVSARHLNGLLALNLGNIGDLMVLGATVLWAYGAVVSKQLLNRMKAGELLAWRGLISSAAAVGTAWFYFGTFPYSQGFLVGYSLTVGAGFLGYYLALERLKASEVATWEIATPFVAMVLAYFWLGEVPTLLQLLGGVVLALGMWVFVRGGRA